MVLDRRKAMMRIAGFESRAVCIAPVSSALKRWLRKSSAVGLLSKCLPDARSGARWEVRVEWEVHSEGYGEKVGWEVRWESRVGGTAGGTSFWTLCDA